MDNMTALVSCFARAYHYRNSNLPVFADYVAEKMDLCCIDSGPDSNDHTI